VISDDAETPHLTPEEVITLLRFVETCRPIIVGGQSINIWAELYYGRNEELDQLGPLTSKDLDFFHNRAAERSLAESLENGQLRVPTGDEHTPSAALVTGTLGGREIVIDFMAQIKGVEDQSILENSITFADADDPTSVSITLMHPMDCVRSRLSNINTLGRTGEHSITQATASLLILDCYIDDQLNAEDKDAGKRALKALRELEYVVRDFHLGQVSHHDFGDVLDPVAIIRRYIDDERIDVRARKMLLQGILDRLGQKQNVAGRRRLTAISPPDA
jgi:hypothetical protein